MTRILVRLLLLASLAVSGCLNPNRISGPDHAEEDPPWVASQAVAAQGSLAVTQRVLLIGDAGLFLKDDPTLSALGRWAADAPQTTVLFLGDNIYNNGLVEEDRPRGEKILAQQLSATAGHKVFVPGNHDWALNPKKMNASAIQNQQAYVDGWQESRAEFLPKNGCMGPATRRLGEGPGRQVTLVLLDPTPWINERLREVCPDDTPESHIADLDHTLGVHADDWVIVASHYPLETGGPHGGLSYGLIAEPIVGMLRFWLGGLGDVYDEGYADWIAAVKPVLAKHLPAVYAAGHDHSLQVLEGGDVVGTQIVSGAGSRDRVTTVTHLESTLFAHAASGFVVLDFGKRGALDAAVLRVVEVNQEAPVFEMELPTPR